MSATAQANAPKPGAPAQKPEQKTDHFKKAVAAVLVFIVVIAAMVLLKGIISPPREIRREEVGRSPVQDPAPGGLSAYEQALAAHRANRQREAPEGQETGHQREQKPDTISQQDMEFVRQGWRQPMKILNRPDDGVTPGTSGTPRPAQPPQPVQPAPAAAPGQVPPMTPEEIVTRYQAAQEKLARLRALQQEQRRQMGVTP